MHCQSTGERRNCDGSRRSVQSSFLTLYCMRSKQCSFCQEDCFNDFVTSAYFCAGLATETAIEFRMLMYNSTGNLVLVIQFLTFQLYWTVVLFVYRWEFRRKKTQLGFYKFYSTRVSYALSPADRSSVERKLKLQNTLVYFERVLSCANVFHVQRNQQNFLNTYSSRGSKAP